MIFTPFTVVNNPPNSLIYYIREKGRKIQNKVNCDGKYYIDSRRKLEDGNINPNRDKKFWLLENRLK